MKNQTTNALEHAAEGAQILQSLIDNIESHGNYSPESTVGFLQQALQCLLPARAVLSEQGEDELEVVATIEVMSYEEETAYIETRSDRINFDNAVNDDALVFKSDAERVISGLSYKAELFDEVWSKAKALGFMNVTMALDELEKLRANPAIAGLLEALGKIATGTTGIMDRDFELAQIAADALTNYRTSLSLKGDE
ncbi:hypothetical protein L1887_47359 [Cichorium endivia]|nr:hypothetical protein L1887_47359 [Cichorium endivia]